MKSGDAVFSPFARWCEKERSQRLAEPSEPVAAATAVIADGEKGPRRYIKMFANLMFGSMHRR